MVAGVLLEDGGHVSGFEQLDDIVRALRHVAQKPAGRARLLAAKREICAGGLAGELVRSGIAGEIRVPQRPRCACDAPERRAVEGCPRGEQARKRVTRQHALLGFARRVSLDARDDLAFKQAKLFGRLARERRVAGEQPGAFPRRQVVVPATRPYGRKHEIPVAKLAAQLQHLGPIAIMNMQVNHRKTVRGGRICPAGILAASGVCAFLAA